MTAGDWDELVRAAKAQLAEQAASEEEASAELGESVDLGEHEVFKGRRRGKGTVQTRRGQVEVLLFWNEDGERVFMWSKARLQREIDELQPNVGDEIVVVRGEDKPSSDPDKNPTQRFAVRTRPSSEPLPDEEPAPELSAPATAPVDDEIPF